MSDGTHHGPKNDAGVSLLGPASGPAFPPRLWLCNTAEPLGPQRS